MESALDSEGRLGQEGNAQATSMEHSLEIEDLRVHQSIRDSAGVGGGAEGLDKGEHSKELPLQLKQTWAGSVLATGAAVEALEKAMPPMRD